MGYVYSNINQSVIITFFSGVRMFERHQHAESCEIFNVKREHFVTFCPLALHRVVSTTGGHPRGQVYGLGQEHVMRRGCANLSFNIKVCHDCWSN